MKGIPTMSTKTVKAKPTTNTSNKFRYYEVTHSSIVRALNATDAAKIAEGKRGVRGSLLGEVMDTFRITADEARSVVEMD